MHTLIHHNQTAYVKNRFIGESIRVIDDILEYADDNQIPSILFQLILKKLSILLITLSCLQYLRNLALALILFIGLGLYTMVQKALSWITVILLDTSP